MWRSFKKIVGLITAYKQEFFLCLFIFFVPLFIFIVGTSVDFIGGKVEARKVSSIESSFSREAGMTLKKIKEAVREGVIDQYILGNDMVKTSAVIKDLAAKYGFSGMVAVNREGIAIARLASSKVGDYVAQTTPWGRRAAQGASVVTVGIGRNLPLLITAAAPIIKNDEVQGALYGAQILDDAYTLNFKKKYLRAAEEMAFYSVKTGIYGNSFENSESQHLLRVYFHEGSDWIQKTRSELSRVRFRVNGKVFHIGNVAFYDLDGNLVGGMLIFFPAKFYLPYIGAGLAGIILFFWCVRHVLKKHKKNRLRQIGILTFIFLLIAGSITAYGYLARWQDYDISKPPYTIYNSTIAFNPDSDLFDRNNEQMVAIQITTGNETINAAEASVKYDPRLIRIEDILMINSFCDQSFMVEKTIDNEKGEAVIACGKQGGFIGDSAILAELLIQPLRTGELSLQFGVNTRVLANDGLGTNILRAITDGTYQIIDLKAQKNGVGQVPLFSDTHPNIARWYNQKNIHISWPHFAGYDDFIYEFDRKPNTVPDGVWHTTATTISAVADEDGVYYFHLAPRTKNYIGEISHLKIMVDTTPPKQPIIKVSAAKVKIGEIIRFEFAGNGDNLSGLQKNFYIKFDKGIWFPALPQLYIPFFKPGEHLVYLRVFDNAGNFSDSVKKIIVR